MSICERTMKTLQTLTSCDNNALLQLQTLIFHPSLSLSHQVFCSCLSVNNYIISYGSHILKIKLTIMTYSICKEYGDMKAIALSDPTPSSQIQMLQMQLLLNLDVY